MTGPITTLAKAGFGVLTSAGLIACATSKPAGDRPAAAMLSGEAVICESPIAMIRAGYTASRVNGCDVGGDGSFVLTITPEAKTDPEGKTINNSPWYGFRVVPQTDGAPVQVALRYEGGSHRYDPKISRDAKSWTRLPDSAVTETADGVRLTLAPGAAPRFVSAQEIFSVAAHDAFTDRIGERGDANVSVIGQSRGGEPIRQIDIATDRDTAKPYVVLVGRQHPPEVTGALALVPFVETVLEGSELSRQFLDRYNLLVVPMINPDGVKAGNWRFGLGGMDLNRDWGPFSQPETQAVRGALERFHSGEDEVIFFLDFHSTRRNLLYTQTDAEPTNPPLFTRDWVAAVKARLSDDVYPFTREDRSNSGRPISKNYMYESFGIPSITYEVGDETPRPAIETSARIFAEEMMRGLIAHAER